MTNSGGTFPVSVTIHGDLAYVLNAEDCGAVQGYRINPGGLEQLPGSNRALGLDPTATPQFTNTPGQVAFSPDGKQLIVNTTANGNDLDVFTVTHDGAQIRATIAITGRVSLGDLTEQMRVEFIGIYRRWQHERDAEDGG